MEGQYDKAVDKLNALADSALFAGKTDECRALKTAAKMLENALRRAYAVENKRDRMAQAALTGILAGGDNRAAEGAARRAYQYADAMIEVSEQ